MQNTALLALFALMTACAMAPEPTDHTTQSAEVQPASFSAGHSLAFHVVDDSSTYLQRVADRTPVVIPREAVRDVTLTLDPRTERPAIAVDFTDDGARLAHEVTAHAIGSKLAVTVDGKVVAQPVIKQAIDGARALITFDSDADMAAAWGIAPGHW
jgi:preprotein translocase subunit SecD